MEVADFGFELEMHFAQVAAEARMVEVVGGRVEVAD